MNQDDIRLLNEKIKEKSQFVDLILSELNKVIVGQKYMLERLMIGLLADGHILLEGVPGLAKTLTVNSLAKTINTTFKRIQFTPDLLPSDVIGTMIYDHENKTFFAQKGPIFANIILADEINRSPAKVQSALLEAMQEKQVTLGKETHKLPSPFLVMATQNPIEQEGTYPLPEAQVDRFMLKLKISYPSKEEERKIIDKVVVKESEKYTIKPVVDVDTIMEARDLIHEVYISDQIKDYIVNIVMATRNPKAFNLDIERFIEYGASPRASIALTLAAKSNAFLRHRGYVTPEDVKSVGYDVLRHRIILTYEAEAEEKTTDDIIKMIFDEIEVP